MRKLSEKEQEAYEKLLESVISADDQTSVELALTTVRTYLDTINAFGEKVALPVRYPIPMMDRFSPFGATRYISPENIDMNPQNYARRKSDG